MTMPAWRADDVLTRAGEPMRWIGELVNSGATPNGAPRTHVSALLARVHNSVSAPHSYVQQLRLWTSRVRGRSAQSCQYGDAPATSEQHRPTEAGVRHYRSHVTAIYPVSKCSAHMR